MTHFLDTRPFDRSLPKSRKCLDALAQAYSNGTKIEELLRNSADDTIKKLHIRLALAKSPLEIWHEIFDLLSPQMLLRELLAHVLQDDKSAAYHDELHALLKEPEEEPEDQQQPIKERRADSLLEDTTWDLVGRLLAEHVLGRPDHRQLLEGFLPAEMAGRITAGGNAAERRDLLLLELKTSSVTDKDPLILRALRALAELAPIAGLAETELLRGAADDLERELRRVRKKKPVEEFILSGGEILWDRSELREGLEELTAGKLALVVTGDPGTGKSYSERLVRHLAKKRGFGVARVSHREASVPEEFIEYLRLDLKLKSSFRSTITDPAKWSRFACRWLVNEALERHNGECWLVVDGFNRERINSDLLDVISTLARHSADETEGKLRLVLLDFQGKLPPEVGNRRATENLKPTRQSDVREFFTDFFATERPGVEPGEEVGPHIDLAVDQAWQKAESRFQAQDADPPEERNPPEERQPFAKLLNEAVAELVMAYSLEDG